MRTDAERREAGRGLWEMAAVLFAHRNWLVGVSIAIAVVTAGITLLIPNSYKATASVLMPEGGSSPLSAALFRNLPSAASSLLGGSSGDYVRYMAILKSRTVMEAAVDSFDLIHVYDLADARNPREEAIKTLKENVTIELDNELDFLLIGAEDTDRDRAANLANFLVRKLNEINSRLSSQNAGNYRLYIQERFFRARAEMDSVLNATAEFQREYGVYDLPTQAASFFEQVAGLRTWALEAEIQHESMLAQFGPNNPQVESSRTLAQAANRKYLNALDGQERLLPVAKSAVPDVGRKYVALELERTIQQAILEILGPMYEQARMQEEQKTQAVQVLDNAVPPAKKSGPKRTIIVLAAAFSAFILAAIYVLFLSLWRENHVYVARRLGAASETIRDKATSTASS